jgi:hypothetical protein
LSMYDGETTVEALEALCQRLASPQLTTISETAHLEKLSAAFAIDSRADAHEMTQVHALLPFFACDAYTPPSSLE